MFFAKKTKSAKNAKRGKNTKENEEYRKVVLKFSLYHGDIVVMHGSRIHEEYLVSASKMSGSTSANIIVAQGRSEGKAPFRSDLQKHRPHALKFHPSRPR